MALLENKILLLCILIPYTIVHTMEIPKPTLNNAQKLLQAVKERNLEEIKLILSCTDLRFHAIAYAYAWAITQAKELTPNKRLRAHSFMQEAVKRVHTQRAIALDRFAVKYKNILMLLLCDQTNDLSVLPYEIRNNIVQHMITCSYHDKICKEKIDETLIDQGNMYHACAEIIYPYLEPLISENSKNPTILAFYIGTFGYLDLLQDCVGPYEKKIDWDFCNPSGKTLLHIHAQEGNLEMVDYLLKKGADYNRQSYYYEKIYEEDKENIFIHKTALHYAAERHHVEIVERLLHAGSNVTIDDHFGKLPLHYVAPGRYGNQKIFEMLLDHGADIDATTNNKTLLWEAIEEKNYITIEYLLKLKANPNRSLPTRISSKNKESFEILLELNADIDSPNYDNKTLLYKAVEEKNFNLIEYLLQLGADPDKELESRFCFETMKFYTDSPLELAYRQAYLNTQSSEEDYEEENEHIYRLLQKYRKKNLSLESSSESS